MADPSEDDVITIIEVTGLDLDDDRPLIIQALKSNGGSVENVINEYFNDGYGFRRKYTAEWDEAMFSADRDGSQNEAGTSFHVEAPDQTQNEVIYGVSPPPGERPGVPSRTAPSRPPSRTSQQGFKDWVDQPAGSNPPTDPALTMTAAPRSHAQEEEDMQRALRESAQEAGVSMPEPEQQTGVTGPSTSATYFGPANRGEYDPSQWTMVPSVEAEIPQASQVAASRRKRGSEVPAFLVEGPSEFGSHRLGALLTILHGIPLVRNLILEAGGPFTSYGHNSQWWKGQQIIPPQVLARLSTGDADPAQLPEGVNFEEELHRLMAFLDSTERSYGTVSVLAHLVPQAWASIERQFYDHFTNRNPAENSPFYSRVAIGKAQSEDDETEQENFCVLESQSTKNTFANIRTLYELIDHIMWGDLLNWQESFDEARMAMFQDMGDILTIDLTGEGPPKSIEIPEEFYPERWLENRKDEAWQIQVAWKETIDAAAKVEDAKVKLYQFYDDEARRAFDIRDVALRAEEHFKSSCEYLEGRGRFRTVEGSGFDLDKYPDFRAAPPQMTAGEDELYKKLKEGASYARRLLEDKRSEMEELNQELKRIEAKQRFLGRLLTKPNKTERPKPMTCKKYLLQGIATKTDVMYVCRRAKKDLIELGDRPKAADQWWRLAYFPDDARQQVKATPLSYAEVHECVWEETKTPLLVYASEQAMSEEATPLSNHLERFAKADNKAFRQELNQEMADPVAEEAGATNPRSPKRKRWADSPDSMATDRASAGSEVGEEVHEIFVDSSTEEGMAEFELMQKRTYGEHSRDMMDLDVSEKAPPLPQRHSVSTENTLTTLTPTTLAAGEGTSSGSPETRQTTPPGSGEATGESAPDESKGPEMQERPRTPTFRRYLISENPEAKTSEPEDMDM